MTLCARCRRNPAVKAVLSFKGDKTRETPLCGPCLSLWREFVVLIYGHGEGQLTS